VAASLCAPPDCIFVTTGRRDLAPFAAHPIRRFLVRAVEEPPPGSLPPNSTLLLDRGPYTVDSELTLFDRHRVGVVVSRDSGGPATYAKIEAARTRAIPVVLVDRPALPDPPPSTVDTVAAALSWCL
jgi:precorrin-6A/cobalt-precorrin-6A reductase